MQYRIRALGIALQNLDGLNRRQDEQFDLAPFGFTLHIFHHRQRTRANAHHEAAALPWYLFFEGERRVPEFGAELLGRFLLALADPSTVDHHIVFVGDAINANGAKAKVLETHDPSLSALYARARGPLIPAPFMPPENFLQPMPDVTPERQIEEGNSAIHDQWY